MANKIELFVEVDPQGRGAAAIKKITADIETLGKSSGQAGSVGREALDGFAGGLGVPTSIAAATSAIGAGILAVGVSSVRAANDAANAQRILKSDAQEARVSLEAAKAEAKKFGEDLAISNTQAEASFAKFLRVLKAAGEVDNTKTYQKNITNLIAAYGIAGNEVETLFNQILSGQDEALNRLGLADPSKIYANYAKEVNKTVDALTQEEKVRSILLALSEKGARFEGAAEERLNSAPGKWQTLEKKILDATAALGKFLNEQTVVGEIPLILTRPFDLVPAKEEELNRKFKAMEEEARRKALADSNAYFQRERDSLGVPEALKNPFQNFQNRVTLLGREQAEKERENFVSQYDSLFKDKRLDKITALFAERQFKEIRGIFDTRKALEIEQQFSQFWDKYAKVALGALKSARDGAEKFYSSVAERGEGRDNPFVKVLIDADEQARNLQKTFGVLGDSATRDLQKIEDSFVKQKTLVLELDAQLKANALRREANNLSNPTGLSGREERLLSELNSRINAATNSPSLLAIANALQNGNVGRVGISGEEILQRRYAQRLGINFDQLTEQQKAKATRNRQAEIDRLNLKQNFTDSGLNISQDEISRKAIQNLRNLQNFGLREGANFGQKATEALNSALVNLFNGLSPELQAAIAKGQEGASVRASFVNAFKGAAEALQTRVEEEIKKQAVADRAIQAVKEDIATIEKLRRSGLSTSQADARLLATTGALDPKELTGDVRQARIEALRREADRQNNLQNEALKVQAETREATNKLTSAIDTLAGEIRKPENRKILIEINNRAKATVREELYGSLTQE